MSAQGKPTGFPYLDAMLKKQRDQQAADKAKQQPKKDAKT